MSRTWFTSDLHLGHVNIGKFRHCIPDSFLVEAEGDSTLANSLWIKHYWMRNVRPNDTVYCLGDNAFTEEGIDLLASLPGTKKMMGGNHDDLPVTSYMRAFDVIRGCQKLRNRRGWVSHFPIHSSELWSNFCNHGHTHFTEIDDWRYINMCCDNLFVHTGNTMISLEALDLVQAKRVLSKEVIW